MDNILLILGGLILGGVVVYFLLRRQNKESGGLLLLQRELQELTRKIDQGLGQSTELVQKQFGTSMKIIGDLKGQLGRLEEKTGQVINFTDQLRNLQDILSNTRQRGALGEYSLELILQNFFPHNYEKQYEFKDGTKVDFAIKVRDKVIPIDSKFSLENYQRILETNDSQERSRFETALKNDLKARIDETAKYIKPSEGTMDFAFMFIPAEALYYDLLVNKIGSIKSNTRDLVEYAMNEKHVIIVSPTSFLAYLQTVLQGLKALQIEESAKEMRKRVEDLSRHLLSYDDYFKKLGKNLGAAVSAYDKAYGEFGKIDKDIYRITGEGMESEALLLAKPHEDE